ncbi:GNAT family N-acetyltransferase [Nocardia abscessus]|uniref:GNAT family N-acetyltransferase n=1 Tax=Nocardia abscessus TaxID=120957 RepID=UPI001893E805|nr:GNAT family N-acetyltransferase [Nocardia abscessus]MBF6337065.1 GNAT family N-acetyltransferase [Nocardia abscessus]
MTRPAPTADTTAVDLGAAVLRRAVASDIPALVGLIYDLAEYEKARHECTVTAEQLRAALFGPEPKVFAHVVADGPELLGCAIWFLNFSTWDGVHGIYLEDLYVKPETRGKGYGKALLAALAKEAVDHGYSRVAWSVLTWNKPSIDFYESIGAVAQDEWAGYRLAGEALGELAAEAR